MKDAIWIDAERARVLKEDAEYENSKFKYMSSRFESLEMLLMDIREVSRNSNYYVKIAAMKGGKKMPKIEYYDNEHLPSVIVENERKRKEEEERRKREDPDGSLTEEEKKKKHDAWFKRMYDTMKRVKELREKQNGEGELGHFYDGENGGAKTEAEKPK